MKLEDFGYSDKLEKLRIESNLSDFEIGRVIAEHKERYIVKTENGEFEAEITGNLRFSAQSRVDFPAVGDMINDFVCMIGYENNEFTLYAIPYIVETGETFSEIRDAEILNKIHDDLGLFIYKIA